MDKSKVKYLLLLFIYCNRERKPVLIDTLFRYFHIYIVSKSYLYNNVEKDLIFSVDNYRGVTNYIELIEQLKLLAKDNYIDINGLSITINQKLVNFILERIENDRIKSDLNEIMYFCDILSNYTDEVILSVFYNEPNIVDANKRNSKIINLNNNKLNKLLIDFEMEVQKLNGIKLDKYDVLISWLNFVFQNYVK